MAKKKKTVAKKAKSAAKEPEKRKRGRPRLNKPKPSPKRRGRPTKWHGLAAVTHSLNKYFPIARGRYRQQHPEGALAKELWDLLRARGQKPTLGNIRAALKELGYIRKKSPPGKKIDPNAPQLPSSYRDEAVYEFWLLDNLANDLLFFDERLWVVSVEILGDGILLECGKAYNYDDTFKPYVAFTNEVNRELGDGDERKYVHFKFKEPKLSKDKKWYTELQACDRYGNELITEFPGLGTPPTGATVTDKPVKLPADKPKPPAGLAATTIEIQQAELARDRAILESDRAALRIRELEFEVEKLKMQMGEKVGGKKTRSASPMVTKGGKKKPAAKREPAAARKTAPSMDNGRAILKLANLYEKGLLTKKEFNAAISKLK
ncbi:MAG: hypothetical protein EXR21_10310 [Flavobacteriaceae bacterium]|nr:hypothetical protein [Flavobacteriaceae bacterium]